MIRTSIKNKLIVYQLHYIVEKTVQVDLVKEIIEYCVPEQILDSLWIMGTVNGKIHAKMEISITYDNGAAVFSVNGNVKDQMFTSTPNKDWLKGEADKEKANCPVWAQAIDWFCQLCKQENLPLKWGVSFSKRVEEMGRKFGLYVLTDEDKTSDSNTSVLPHKTLPMNMAMAFSDEFGGQKS